MDIESVEIPVSSQAHGLLSSALWALAMCVVGTFLVAGLLGPQRRPDEIGWVYLLAALFSISIGIPFFFALWQGTGPRRLRIEKEHIRWGFVGGEITVPYGDLCAARKEGRGRRERLVLESRERPPLVIRTALFPEGTQADSVLEAVREHAGRLPDRPARPETVSVRNVEQPCAVSLSVSALLVLVFLAELAVHSLDDPLRLLVREGEMFRLATASLLHVSLRHLTLNVLALVGFGSVLEPLLGRTRFLTVLLISALAGSAGSAYLGHNVPGLGISAGLAGLLGAYLVIRWRWSDRIVKRPTVLIWLEITAAFLLSTATLRMSVVMGNLTGCLAGFALVSLETRNAELAELPSRHRADLRFAAACLVAFFVTGVGMAAQQVWRDSGSDHVASTRTTIN